MCVCRVSREVDARGGEALGEQVRVGGQHVLHGGWKAPKGVACEAVGQKERVRRDEPS